MRPGRRGRFRNTVVFWYNLLRMNDPSKIEFLIFCIENVAEALGVSGAVAYRKLAVESDILSGYIAKNYDVLHTQGSAWIREDLLAVMRRKGVAS